MALLIRTNENQSFWIDVDDSKFLVRPLTSTQEQALQKEHTSFNRGLPQQDTEAIKRERFRKMVLDWRNVQDIEGNEVPFSEQVRDSFAEYNPQFAWLVIRKCESHDIAAKEQEHDNLGEQ